MIYDDEYVLSAIEELAPKAKFKLTDNGGIDWLDERPMPSENDILNLKTQKLDADKAKREALKQAKEARLNRIKASRASLDRMTLPELRIVVRDILEHLGIHEEISKDSEVN